MPRGDGRARRAAGDADGRGQERSATSCRRLRAAGTALVISPLIALMDDQAAKLTAAGLRVARIHSGLSREDARQACRDYLDGALNFLFIAPERMRVPGFPEMLARRKPSLIAIDEAHCISAWGHDFRPDYRTLGEHLPALRPAPIIALTATATPTVQTGHCGAVAAARSGAVHPWLSRDRTWRLRWWRCRSRGGTGLRLSC